MSLRRFGQALSGLLAIAVIGLVAPSPASAASAPTGLAPQGSISSSTPTFSWNRVSSATGYQLQVTRDSNSATLISDTTQNDKYVPTTNLPDGGISWQVRALTATGPGPWASASATITPTAAPSLTSPSDGEHLTQPDEPPLFTWSAVTGAVGYEVQVDSTGTWVSPTTYTSSGNTYFVESPQAPGTWYWRVRANRGNGLYTSWSNGSSYDIDPLEDPQAGADMSSGTPIQDVKIDWQPVDGATAYQLQVGRDKDFNNLVDNVIVYGTKYSPASTYNNDQYYWRVRAIDAGGNRMPWTTALPFVFQRNWPEKPTLQYPANAFAPTVGDPMYYQWTPVHRASRYQLDVGSDPNFSPGTYSTCVTTGTTYPVTDGCAPLGQGATTYWRVKGLDDPSTVEGIYSEIHHFVYSSGKITQLSPASGSTVDVPTLTWQAVANVQTYQVVVKDKNGNAAASTNTSSTSWTPESALPSSGNPYTWTVRAQPAQGAISPLYPGSTFNVSGNVPTDDPALVPITGTSGSPATTDFPNLTWSGMTGAAYYRVRIGVQGSGFYDVGVSHISDATYPYPAATDTATHYLSPGTYFWFVDAYDSSNQLIDETPADSYGEFKIKDLAPVSGQEVALDGLAAVDPASGCGSALSDGQLCTGLWSTPVLKWAPEQGAAGYLVYLGNDQEFTSRVVSPYAFTTNTLWRPPSDLPDNTAQDAYYWFVRPCKSVAPLVCNPDPISTHAAATNAFRKESPAVDLQGPADQASVTSNPTFGWTDYLDTNNTVHYANGVDASYQTARTYRIQISQTSTFNTLVDEREVDQPFYTPFDRTLPQGKLYWRVQAIDPSGNHLKWSEVRSFVNSEPPIDLPDDDVTLPANNATVGGSTPFRWNPVDGALAYQIEVYNGDHGTHSPGNLVFSATSHQPAYVWSSWLPPSSQDYTWRVRWLDGDGQPRPWSDDAHFSVNSTAVVLTSPAADTFQPFNGVYLTWDPVSFAASYRVDFRDANGNISPVGTAATAYALSTANDGVYDWRVAALDPNGHAIAISGWRSFTVDGHAPVVTAYSPSSVGTPKSKVKVTFNEKVLGVSTTSFTLHVKGRSSRLPAKVKLSSTGRDAVLTPNAHLVKGKLYKATLSKTIHDKAGNHMTKLVWSFTV